MAVYRYLFGSTRDGRVTAEIPVYGGYITDVLNDVGYMQGSFNLDQTGKSNEEMVTATIPGASWTAVFRDDMLFWAGFITSRTYQSQSKSIQYYAKTFEGYLEMRLVCSFTIFNDTFVRTNVDQGEIFYNLLQRLGSAADININVWDAGGNNPLPGPVTGVLKTVDIKSRDFKTYRNVIDEMANSDDGFDWRFRPRFRVDPIVGGSQPLELESLDVIFGYPSLGLISGASSKVFEYPGNILNYYRTDNLSGAGTNIYGQGAGSGDDMLVSTATTGASNLFFTIHRPVPLKHLTTQAALDARTAQEAVKRKPPRTQYKVTLRPDRTPVLGTWELGDAVQLLIEDAMHPSGVNVPARISAYTLTPSSDENPEEVSLEFVGDFEE